MRRLPGLSAESDLTIRIQWWWWRRAALIYSMFWNRIPPPLGTKRGNRRHLRRNLNLPLSRETIKQSARAAGWRYPWQIQRRPIRRLNSRRQGRKHQLYMPIICNRFAPYMARKAWSMPSWRQDRVARTLPVIIICITSNIWEITHRLWPWAIAQRPRLISYPRFPLWVLRETTVAIEGLVVSAEWPYTPSRGCRRAVITIRFSRRMTCKKKI